MALTGAAMATDKGYDKLSKGIKFLSSNPQHIPDIMNASLGGLDRHIPNIAQEMHTASIQGVAFLASKLPQPPSVPTQQEFKPSLAQRTTFMNYATAVQNPLSVLKQLKSGNVSPQAMEALQAVHPALLKQMQGRVMTEMQKQDPAKIPYRVKQAVSLFTGQPVDSSVMPQSIMANQAALSGPQLGKQQAAPSGRRAGGGAHALSKLNLSSRAGSQVRDRQVDEET